MDALMEDRPVRCSCDECSAYTIGRLAGMLLRTWKPGQTAGQAGAALAHAHQAMKGPHPMLTSNIARPGHQTL